MSDEMAGAGITAKERLERIELMLSRIDGKLDGKADQSDLMALEGRVRQIEQHGGPATSAAMRDVHDLRTEAREQIDSLSQSVTALKNRMAQVAGGLAVVVFGLNIAIAFFRH
jgi:hypothetical protein